MSTAICLRGCAWLLIALAAACAVLTSAQDSSRSAPGFANPEQVQWDPGARVFRVHKRGPETIAAVSPQGEVSSDRPTGLPAGVVSSAVLKDGSTAWVDLWTPALFVRAGGQTKAVEIPPRPRALTADPDGRSVWIVCDSTDRPRSLVRVEVSSGMVESRPLPGFSNLRGLAASGDFVLVTHLIPKSNLPSTQIEQGWVFTNAVSIVPHEPAQPVLTIPLDLRTQGFANPEGVALSPDGRTAWIAHSGADLVSVVDLEKARSVVSPGEFDLTRTRRYVRARIPVGSSPSGIALSEDGRTVALSHRLGDSLSLIDVPSLKVVRTVPLGSQADDPVRRGERLFHSSRLSHSGQFSCASCHPDGHADGLNWDLPADGFNNFQNTKSLFDIEGTAPYGWLGLSATLPDRFQGTLRHLFQHEPTAEEVADMGAYLSQLRSPAQTAREGSLPGKAIFEGKAGCAECHSGPRLTDRLAHDVLELGHAYDTPSLRGIRHSAPYLHDGRSPSLESIFREHNPSRLHGHASDLTPEEFRSLMEYLRSL